MTREDKTFHLRLPAKEYARLAKEAKARKWSLNTYLNHLVTTHQERK
jgi:predicted HicB family RNase H-like nuclease